MAVTPRPALALALALAVVGRARGDVECGVESVDYNGGDMRCSGSNPKCQSTCCFFTSPDGRSIDHPGQCCQLCINTPDCACWSWGPNISAHGEVHNTCYLKNATGWTPDGRTSHSAGCLSQDSFGDTCTCPGYTPAAPSHVDAAEKPVSSGTIILLVAGIGGTMYLVIGFMLGVQAGRSGLAALPHREFWATVPGLIGAGCVFTIGGGIKKARAARGFDSYENL